MKIELPLLSMTAPLTLLLIEDDADDAELIVREFARGGWTTDWRRVDSAAALRAALRERPWDVVTCDWVMPGFGAIEALAVLREMNVEAPIIIVSGEVGEEVAVTAMRHGAHDFVSKQRLARLCPAVERELRETEVRRAHRRAEAALRESEDRYRDLVEHSHDLICTHDLEGRILSVNPAPARVLGYEPAELLTMRLTDILAPEARPLVPAYLATLRREGLARGLMTVQTRGGERRVWEYTNTLRTDGVPVPIARGMAHDVTERLRSERLLRQSEQHFRALTQNAADLVAILDADGTIRYASPSHAQAIGFDPQELIGRQAFDLVHPDDRDRLWQAFAEGIGGVGSTAAAEYRFRRKDGSWAVFEAVAKNLVNDPLIRGVLINSRDISDRITAVQALRRLVARQAGILDALPANIALVDQQGTVVVVNRAWRDFAVANGFVGAAAGVGANYLAVCETARGGDAPLAQAAADGVRAVLAGTLPAFTLEYPCHSPDQRRWFRLMAAPLVVGQPEGAVVMHLDVTDRVLADETIERLTAASKAHPEH